MFLQEISAEEFEKFAEEYSYSSILQTKEYAEVMKNQGSTPIFIGLYDNELCAASLILISKIKGYKYAYAPRGFLIDYTNKKQLEAMTKEIKKFLIKKDVVALKICPPLIKSILNSSGKTIGVNPTFDESFNNLKDLGYHHFGFNSLFESYKPRFEAIIDLTIDFNQLFENIKKEYRTKIRSSEKKGIKIYRANSNEIDLIYNHAKNKYPRDLKYFQDSFKEFSASNKMEYYYAKLDTNQYLAYSKKEFEIAEERLYQLNQELIENNSDKLVSKKMEADYHLSIAREQLKEANKLASREEKGVVLASMLIAKNKNEVYLYMDGFDTNYKNFNGKHILIWKVMEKYSKLGYKRFNLGGVTDIRNNNEKYIGLNKFKTNFNASIVEYAGDFELVINQAKYFIYRQLGSK